MGSAFLDFLFPTLTSGLALLASALATVFFTALPALALAFRVGGLLFDTTAVVWWVDAPLALAFRFFFPLSFRLGGIITPAEDITQIFADCQ